MNCVDRVKAICKERRIPLSKLERDLGFANGYIGQLRKGVFPTDRLMLIADYLSVSPTYLITGEQEAKENPPALNSRDKRDIAKDLEEMMAHLDNAGDLMFDGDPMSDEARATIRAAMQLGLEAAKLKNKERFTPNKYKKG